MVIRLIDTNGRVGLVVVHYGVVGALAAMNINNLPPWGALRTARAHAGAHFYAMLEPTWPQATGFMSVNSI